MRYFFILYFSVIAMCLTQCYRDHCYDLDVEFRQDPTIEEDDPVFYDDGIVGRVKSVRKSNENTVASVCIFDSVNIPKNSVWMSGYIGLFATRGIQIISSEDEKFAQKGDFLQGVVKDSIHLTLPDIDSARVEKLIEVMKDLNKNN